MPGDNRITVRYYSITSPMMMKGWVGTGTVKLFGVIAEEAGEGLAFNCIAVHK
ncbi:hypothetical protein [Paenibacillus sp. y28]|uniref:hypothetical protein n=1 Tax=Paenibacillus sp. y28 TaxID=3129110 RepID=UPI00301ADBD6